MCYMTHSFSYMAHPKKTGRQLTGFRLPPNPMLSSGLMRMFRLSRLAVAEVAVLKLDDLGRFSLRFRRVLHGFGLFGVAFG